MTKISIVTAVYNREATIAHAITSVATQTWPQIEHLVVDGASTDGTLAAVTAASHPRMHLLSEPDRGIYDALNKGIARSTGDVVGVLHSDDYFAHEGVLSAVASAFSSRRVMAVYGNLDYVSADDEARVIRHWRSGDYSPEKLQRGWMPPHPALFLRREVFDRYGAYDTTYRISADYDAILRYFSRGDLKPVYLPEVLVKMRVGGASNGSIGRLIRKSREDYRALRKNEIGGLGALVWKNVSKIGQFAARSTRQEGRK